MQVVRTEGVGRGGSNGDKRKGDEGGDDLAHDRLQFSVVLLKFSEIDE